MPGWASYASHGGLAALAGYPVSSQATQDLVALVDIALANLRGADFASSTSVAQNVWLHPQQLCSFRLGEGKAVAEFTLLCRDGLKDYLDGLSDNWLEITGIK